jgi:prepilin-type N-terminal cleavage/methylation domain-containing protein
MMKTLDSSRKPYAQTGFTLIELLVVVAIIAVLISILLPALSRARDMARRAVCLSNQRQIGIQMSGYSQEYNGFTPDATMYNPGTPPRPAYTYNYDQTFYARANGQVMSLGHFFLERDNPAVITSWKLKRYMVEPRILYCPSNKTLPYHVLTDPPSGTGTMWYSPGPLWNLVTCYNARTGVRLDDYSSRAVGTDMAWSQIHLNHVNPIGFNVLFGDGSVNWLADSKMYIYSLLNPLWAGMSGANTFEVWAELDKRR